MSFNNLNSERERAYSMESDYKKSNPKSGIEVRDRYHSIYKDHMESKYTEEDWKTFEIRIKNKSIIEGVQAKECSLAWRRGVVNET